MLEVRLGLKSPDEPIKGVYAAEVKGLYGMYPGKVKVGIFFPDLWLLTSSVSNKVWFAFVNEGCV